MENKVRRKDKLSVNRKRVVIAGDLVLDNDLEHNPAITTENYEISKNIDNNVPKNGGAWYLKDIVELACTGINPKIKMLQDQKANGNNTNNAYQVWALYEQEKGSKRKVWRIKEFLGCKHSADELTADDWAKGLHDADILVLDNIGLGFFNIQKQFTESLKQATNIQDIVLKMSSLPTNSNSSDPSNILFRDFNDKVTVVVSVDALRRRGADISSGLSWDYAIEKVVSEYKEGMSSQDLARCKRSIVYFENEGAACFVKGKGTQPAQLEHFLYDPGKCEGAFRAKRPGTIFGTSTFISAAMVRHILEPETYPLFIAVGRALAASRINYHIGGGAGKNLNVNAANEAIKKVFLNDISDAKEIESSLCSAERAREIKEILSNIAMNNEICSVLNLTENEPAAIFSSAFRHDLLSNPPKRQDGRSDLLQDATGTGIEYISAKAFEVVAIGTEKALKNVPMACYGKYKTADREEIDRINAVRNLIIQYRENNSDYKPLSIAVFGAPGSGKSFAIKQLSEELFGATKSILEFNLSQFKHTEEIHTAFHQIRDASVQRQIPIVFWDEFDSNNLSWLKEFLAPMQDAKFTAGNITHPFGKAIFVFAGSTHETFEAFARYNNSGEDTAFKELKGPDFVSRLRGFINIKGPNPSLLSPDKHGVKKLTREQLINHDPAHLIRRAILLRSLVEKGYPHLLEQGTGRAFISASVLHGFLSAGKFLHGARSLEAIVVMSNLVNTAYYGISQLPPPDLLNLHVTPDFLEIAKKGQMENSIIEIIAEACHKSWRKQKEKDGYVHGKERNDIESKDKKKTHPLLKDYNELSEADKEGNRTTARKTAAKLHEIGYEIKKIHEIKKMGLVKKNNFPKDKFVQLTEIEHDIWLREKLIQGYAYAEVTNDSLRLHRSVERFENLTPEDKLLDAAIVNSFIDSMPDLEKNGYGITKSKTV